MKKETKHGIFAVFLIVFLYICAYLFSYFTNYNTVDSIIFFVAFPLMVLAALLYNIPKIWKVVTLVLAFVTLCFPLFESPKFSSVEFIFFSFVIVYLIIVCYCSEKNKRKKN
ncbi:hypothetical protein MmiEs2_09730 [Methanimicrococcus stummii]|uniref:Uncharacterized protein n=1 Tax=Methanimicrococcus stummii TaxID=3028294 RepID=A0AA96VAL6_9EURY|nr:hypothetical protein MmiEs2_09730 [Methanimicrococcus sp. Es2]